MRRNALGKFFSRAQVSRLEPTIYDFAQRLCDKILVVGQRAPFDLTTAFSLFTTDVISGYCLGESLGLIAQKGWHPNFREPLYAQLRLVYLYRFIPFLKHAGVATAIEAYLNRHEDVDMPNYVKKAQADKDNGLDNSNTVFGSLLESELPPSEKSLQRMIGEGFSLFAAGTETVSWALTVITYHLLNQPALLSKLTAEVDQAIEDDNNDSAEPGQIPSWAALEKRPYLRAVIHEGLRLSYGVASRTSRIAMGEDLLYCGEWTPKGSPRSKKVEHMIPRGYAVGMSSVITHHDESVFPDSHSFVPERWLDEKGQHRKQLDHALLAFSKGSRSCVGINLAYCELYLLLAMLAVRVYPRLQLYDTMEKDVAYDHDFFNPFPVWDSKGVRAIIVGA
ncbi:MAG: hypothetical protein Q9221_005471 [Calogaya cf. arnoldii]